MPNSPGPLSSALVVQRALELSRQMYPVLQNISTDMSDQAVDFGQAIQTRAHTAATVQDFGTGATDRTDTPINVTMNAHKEVHHKFTVTEYSGTKRNLVDESAEPLAEAIGRHMVDAIAALWTNANYGGGSTQETITTAANFNYNALTTIREVLNAPARSVAKNKRFVVVNSAGYKTLLQDPMTAAAQNNPRATDVIVDGMLTGVAGFQVFEFPGLPTTGTSSGTKVAVAGAPSSSVLVTRIQKDPSVILPGAPFPGNYGVITNQETGLSVLLTEWINPVNMEANIRVSWMYGVGVGKSQNLQIIKTA